MNLGNFNANEHKPVDSFDVIPAGEYKAIIVDTAEKGNESGWRGLQLKMQIVDGEYKDRFVFDQITVAHATSTKAVDFGHRILGDICRATNVLSPQDSSEFHGKMVSIKVAIDPAKNGYDAKNTVKKYDVVSGGSAPAAPAGNPWGR